jgi:hypothetical protein
LGQYSSDVADYERNVKAWGSRDRVDLVVGDARQTLLPVIAGEGFSVAFLDVDVYDVMREILSQLWSEARGGEVIIVHDVSSPGVRKAVDEFHIIAKSLCKETVVENGSTSILTIRGIQLGTQRPMPSEARAHSGNGKTPCPPNGLRPVHFVSSQSTDKVFCE